MSPPVKKRAAHVANINIRVLLAEVHQLLDLSLELLLSPGRQYNQVSRPRAMATFNHWRLFDHHVGICAAEAKRADSRTPGISVRDIPFLQLCIHIERTLCEPNGRIARLKMQRGWNLFVLQGQQDLEHSGDAGSRCGVPEIGLYRADRTETILLGIPAEGLR